MNPLDLINYLESKSTWEGNFLLIDDFLNEEDKNYILDFIRNLDYSKFRSKVGCFPIQVCLDTRIPQNIRDDFQRIAEKYKPILIKHLKDISPRKYPLIDYCKFKIIISPPGFQEGTHIDNFSKLLNGIIYLAPEKTMELLFMNQLLIKIQLKLNGR